MADSEHPSDPLPLNLAARHLHVPVRWLREEVDSGRIPALVAGRSVLIHVPTVAEILAERAKTEVRGRAAEGGAAADRARGAREGLAHVQ